MHNWINPLVVNKKEHLSNETWYKLNQFINKAIHKGNREDRQLIELNENITLMLKQSYGLEAIMYEKGIDIGFINYFKKYDPDGQLLLDYFQFNEEGEILENV